MAQEEPQPDEYVPQLAAGLCLRAPHVNPSVHAAAPTGIDNADVIDLVGHAVLDSWKAEWARAVEAGRVPPCPSKLFRQLANWDAAQRTHVSEDGPLRIACGMVGIDTEAKCELLMTNFIKRAEIDGKVFMLDCGLRIEKMANVNRWMQGARNPRDIYKCTMQKLRNEGEWHHWRVCFQMLGYALRYGALTGWEGLQPRILQGLHSSRTQEDWLQLGCDMKYGTLLGSWVAPATYVYFILCAALGPDANRLMEENKQRMATLGATVVTLRRGPPTEERSMAHTLRTLREAGALDPNSYFSLRRVPGGVPRHARLLCAIAKAGDGHAMKELLMCPNVDFNMRCASTTGRVGSVFHFTTPLMLAVRQAFTNGSLGACEALLDYGQNSLCFTMRDGLGNTALHHAVHGAFIEEEAGDAPTFRPHLIPRSALMVKVLLSHCRDLAHIENDAGLTARQAFEKHLYRALAKGEFVRWTLHDSPVADGIDCLRSQLPLPTDLA